MSDQQRNLFGDDAVPWEEDDAAEQLVATVVFVEGPVQPFDYSVPDALRDRLQPGMRVRVPLGRGNRPMVGYCVELATQRVVSRRLKPVARLVDDRGLFTPAMLRLTRWMAEHYICPWGQVLESVIPAGVRDQAGTRQAKLLRLPDDLSARLADQKLTTRQQQILDRLRAAPNPITAGELAASVGCTVAPINTLRKKGLIEVHVERRNRKLAPVADEAREVNFSLNDDQQAALTSILAALDARRHETLLLHGVTGSGKTEVYIQAIQHVVSFGRQAIVLVPEISLTPQTRQRFRARFDEVAVLHSHLTDSERHHEWQRIAEGQVQVIVGARSAIFAPAPHLGLIVLDEEHETSFKQDSAPRYHARDVALERASRENIPLVLGSATPSLESWHHARQGRYRLLELPRRVYDRPLPVVNTIDLKIEALERRSKGAISRRLRLAMEESLRVGGQVILLLNRRGFSTHIQCPACGDVIQCPSCEIALTHHRQQQIALCHYCDYQIPAPAACPACDFAGLRYAGLGTQRLEAEVRARFPDFPCLRMDTDAMQRHGSHEQALARFRAGDVRILLGTQMIAKGLDFPNVTLVGVINADTSLHLPDFRAAERTFQLLAQVAGRTGRGDKGGRVLIQTFSPDHAAIQAAVHHDSDRFAEYELPIRESLGYPPFGQMIRIVVRGPLDATVSQFADYLSEQLQAEFERRQLAARLLGPAPAPFPKLRGKFRYHMQLQSGDGDTLRAAVAQVMTQVQPPDELEWIVDVDPLTML